MTHLRMHLHDFPLNFQEDIIVNTDKDSKGNVQQFLEIKNVTEKDGGEYACVANNNEGSTYSEPINIHVICKRFC